MIGRRSLLGALATIAAARRTRAAAKPIAIALSSNSMGFGGLRIAEQAGLFERNGIGLNVRLMESGSAASAAMISGSVELCTASLGEVLAARLHGQHLVVVANAYRGLAGSMVLSKAAAEKLGVPATAPVQAKLKAIAGLSIATPSAVSSYTFPFRVAGQAVGAQPRFVYMGQPAMLAALRTGAIQGMVAGAPFSTQAVASGTGVMWVNGPKNELPADAIPTSSSTIVMTEAYAKANADVIARLRTAFAAVGTMIVDQPQEAERLLAAAYPQLDADTMLDVFRNDAPNWTRPVLTVDDIRFEIALQQRAGVLKGLEGVDPVSILAP